MKKFFLAIFTALVCLGAADKNLTTYQLYMREASGPDKITLSPPALGASYTLTLPTTGGTSGYLLSTNGSGTTSWSLIANANVDASAAIAYSKLNLATSIVNADISGSAAIAYSKLNLATSILNADINASAAIDASKIADGSVSSTEFQYINTLSSNAQTQFDSKVNLSTYSAKGAIPVGTGSGTVSTLTVGTDGQVPIADSGQTTGWRWSTPAASSGLNYITNPDAETNTTGWTTYAGGTTSPTSGTGGSPNSTWTRTTTTPLRGSGAFLITLNTGASRQGEGVCTPITIDNADSVAPKVQQIEFDYKIVTGTFVAGSSTDRTSAGDSDLTVWVVDTTSGQVIQPSTYRLYSTVADRFIGNFQNNYNSTSYRVCVHKGTSTTVSGTAITVQFDDFKVSPSKYTYGTPITDWISWTPTGSWTGGTATYTGLKRRVGSDGEYKVNIAISGGVTAANLTVNLPTNETIDTTKIINSTSNGDWSFGQVTMLDAGTATYVGAVSYNNTTSLQMRVFDAASAYLKDVGALSNSVPVTWGASDNISMQFKVPISGWTSSVIMSSGYDAIPITATYRSSADITIGTSNADVVWNTLIDDPAAICNTSTGVCTIPKPRKYVLSFNGRLDVGGSIPGEVQCAYIVTGKSAGTWIVFDSSTFTASKISWIGGKVELQMNAGDTAKLNCVSTTNSSTLKGGASLYSSMSIAEIATPQSIATSTEVERSTRAYITGASTITSQDADSWLSSVTNNATGDRTLNIIAGKFASAPTCTISVIESSTAIPNVWIIAKVVSTSTSAIRFLTYYGATATSTANNYDVQVLCKGPKY